MTPPVPEIDTSEELRGHNMFDVEAVRSEFPILDQQVHGKPLVYLDNGATSQKPQVVIDAITEYYQRDNSNIHRGVHTLSERATEAYENVRDIAQRFLNAPDRHEIVFVRGTTEGINLVAQAWARPLLKAGDEIIISTMEHHSNIVPWQLVCEQTGAVLKVIPINSAGELDLQAYRELLSERTKLVSVVHLSNALGTINPVREMADAAHKVGAKILLDGAQAAPHMPVDVQDLDCDFYTFSGHKTFGPTGIGVLWGRHEILDAMPPYQGGGEMIRIVRFEGSTWNSVPHRFEAGTPNIADTVGLGVALEYLMSFDMAAVAAHEDDLLEYGTQVIGDLPGVRLVGTAKKKSAILSFIMDDIHAHDIGTIVDSQGVAIRVGHHCTMPLHESLGLNATARASFALYNTRSEIDRLAEALLKTRQMFTA
jgi:cysteine desulfurase/selenocysteine lyase